MANLAAKYRPKTLEDVTEQSIVVDMVRNLDQQDVGRPSLYIVRLEPRMGGLLWVKLK